MPSYDANPELAEGIRRELRQDLVGYTICPGRGPIIG